MTEISKQPCPHTSCGSSDAFCWNTEKHVGICYSCGQAYPQKKMDVFDWASDKYPLTKGVATKEVVDDSGWLDDTTTLSNDNLEAGDGYYHPMRGILKGAMQFYNCLTYDKDGSPHHHDYIYPDGGIKTRIFPKEFTAKNFRSDQLFGMNLFPAGSAGAVTITEGELDAMSAFQMLGSQYPVVSLPSATPAKRLLENCKDWLGSFEKIYLSLDADEKAEKFAIALMNLFPGRVYKVPHDKFKDANAFLEAGQGNAYKRAWWNAKLYTPENIYASEEDFLTLLHDTPDHSYVPTNIKELDDKILGLMQGHFTVIKGPTGIGKSLSPETPVIKFDGSVVRADQVYVGDKLMGPDGKARNVLEVNLQKGPMYEIRPVKGEPFKCNADHILSLRHTTSGKVKNVLLSDYLVWSKTQKNLWKLYRSGVESFDYDGPREIALSYAVGAYLGDGRVQGPEICLGKTKQGVIDYLLETKMVEPTRLPFRSGAWHIGFSKKSLLWKYLTGNHPTGWQDCLSVRKIPDNQKRGCWDNRTNVLAGLLDTDGSVTDGGAEITQKSELLADDICFVARSLSLAAYKKQKVVNGVKYFRVTISGDLTMLPCKRLKFTPRKQIKSVLNTGFDVVAIEDGIYRGIMLDGDHLFLLGDFTVTHNSELMRYLEYNFISNYPEVTFASWHLEETKLRGILGLVSYALKDNLTRKDLITDKNRMADVEVSIKDITNKSGYMQFHLREQDGAEALIDQIRILTQVYGCKYVLFEPIQDVINTGSEDSKEPVLADLAVRLSKLAADLNVGIVTIAHTNEDGEVKYCKMIGQRASVVIDLTRDKDSDNHLDKNTLKLAVKKNRPCSLEGEAGSMVFDQDTFTLAELGSGW